MLCVYLTNQKQARGSTRAFLRYFFLSLLAFFFMSFISTIHAQTSMSELKNSLISTSLQLSKENSLLRSDLSQSKKDSTELRTRVLLSQTELIKATTELDEKKNSLKNLQASSDNFQKNADAEIKRLKRQRIYIIAGSVGAVVLTAYLVKKI